MQSGVGRSAVSRIYLFLSLEDVCVEYHVIPNQPKEVVGREREEEV